ncbi:YetF domain-containing protein [Phycisphaerales bacterium ac7]
MFFDGWQGIFRVVAVGVPAYAALVFLLRISGKRTLSKMNAFDLVITVAFGSTLATILLSTDVALAEGVAALALLIALQFIVAWSASRWAFVDHIVKAEPVMVYHRGRFLTSTMRRERVTRSEILAAIRGENNASTTEVESVVLETTGDFSVIRKDAHASEDDALDEVRCPSSCSTTQVSAEPSADQPYTLK